MLTSFGKADWKVMTTIGEKRNISEQQPISNQAEETFSKKAKEKQNEF